MRHEKYIKPTIKVNNFKFNDIITESKGCPGIECETDGPKKVTSPFLVPDETLKKQQDPFGENIFSLKQ